MRTPNSARPEPVRVGPAPDFGEPWLAKVSPGRQAVETNDGREAADCSFVGTVGEAGECAERIAECVNACRGIGDPADALSVAARTLRLLRDRLGAFCGALAETTDCSDDVEAMDAANYALGRLGR